MTFPELTQAVNNYNGASIIEFILNNREAIKILFLNAGDSVETQTLVSESFLALNGKNYDDSVRNSDSFQGLVNHFAIYFKKVNRVALVQACRNLSLNLPFRKRIEAYIFYKSYNDVLQHITRLEEYLNRTSLALYSDDADYTSEMVDDIIEYYHFGKQQLQQFGQGHRIAEFLTFFEKDEIVSSYPILHQILAKLFRSLELPVNELTAKIQEPSEFFEFLFDDKIIKYIKEHPKTVWSEKPLGYPKDVIRYDIIATGLADFDEPFKELSPRDKVKLYCYFNLRKHYFTSYSIFERLETLLTIYQSKKRIKFIDIGCGPATSGIAFIDYIYNQTLTPVRFDYHGVDISQAMLQEASDFLDNEAVDKMSHVQLYESVDKINRTDLSDGACILINTCYLFASVRLDVNGLANFVKQVRTENKKVPMFLLFQNPEDKTKNENYFRFKELIKPFDTQYSAVDVVYYNNKRNSPFKPVPERVYYELLKL